VKLTTHFQLVPRSRKRGSVHLLPHTPSWRNAQGQLYLYTYVLRRFLFSLFYKYVAFLSGDNEIFLEDPAANSEWGISLFQFIQRTTNRNMRQLQALIFPTTFLCTTRRTLYQGAVFICPPPDRILIQHTLIATMTRNLYKHGTFYLVVSSTIPASVSCEILSWECY
jgi:hypothetical protein